MSTDNNPRYKLKFLNEREFEILCTNKPEILTIKFELDRVEFVKNLSIGADLDPYYPDKLIGETSSQEKLAQLIEDWYDLIDNARTKTYYDIDKNKE
ncbi:hypothetical protein [uncultured Acinetobacter sp.]|uniref:hypothetical protein n=1 Tax=uncultured Acinetobacter sp. TaxID=165433 RepID=UPI00258A9D21|nr:hypothetical protein [uncultured Acinetobacter sp.]